MPILVLAPAAFFRTTETTRLHEFANYVDEGHQDNKHREQDIEIHFITLGLIIYRYQSLRK